MTKVDFKKEWKHLYNPPKGKFTVVEVPSMQFLMLDGRGDPNTAKEYQDAIEALYAVAFKIKFASKKSLGKDYVVPPLEGLWGSGEMETRLSEARDEAEWLELFAATDRDTWRWTMMIMQPEWVTEDMYEEVSELVREAKGLSAIDKMRLETYREGLSVQIMHVGPFSDEGPALAKLHLDFLPNNGYVEAGKHHEIYLSDPRKTAPEKLKTVLRQPVRKM
ncbi:MAG: hypothetical protein GTO14_00570 [Anaerolineales bacterium]|nr:hypothetical protein [Anaerolineales bacterium]